MSRYRDVFKPMLNWHLLLRAAVVYSFWDGIWGPIVLGIFVGFDVLYLFVSIRLVYWTKRLHKAQADAAVLDATLFVEREYSRYLDEH